MLQLETAENEKKEEMMEVVTLKRIQNEQGKALSKMVNENNYPQKFKLLVDDVKCKKDRIRLHEETIKQLQRSAMQQANMIAILTKQLRDMKSKF